MEIHIERKLFKMLAAESDANFEEVWSNDLDELMCEFRRLRKEAVDKALDEVEKRHPKPVVQEIPEECPVCKIPIATMLIPWQGPPDSWGQLAFHIMYAHTPEFVDITCPCGFYSGDAGFYKEVAHLQAQPDLAKHLNDALTNKNR